MCYFYVGDSKGNPKTRSDSAEDDNMTTEEKELKTDSQILNFSQNLVVR